MEKLSNKDIKELIEKSYNSRINILKMMKNREGHIGTPLTLEYADSIGAAGYATDASSAVDLANELLS